MVDAEKFKSLQQSLMSLSNSGPYIEGDKNSKLRSILKESAKQLKASRAAIWRFEDGDQLLHCEHLYNLQDDHFDQGQTLKQSDYPNYFREVHASRIIDASDARQDKRTAEFSEHYLIPQNIYSMLDVPLHFSGRYSGILCIEHADSTRNWDVAEMSYATSIADTISLLDEREVWIEAQKKLTSLEQTDTLTGLENRNFFQQRIKKDSKLAASDSRAACIVYGIDYFTGVNDTYGFQGADRLLRELSRRFHKWGEQTGTNISRLGGDTFGFWMPALNHEHQLESHLSDINKMTTQPISVSDNEQIEIKASMGVVVLSEQQKIEDPIRCAEIAMNKAKSQRRGSQAYFSPKWLKELNTDKELEAQVLLAFEHQQLLAHYQPIIASETGSIAGVEALVRWQHPGKGLIPPFQFLPIVTQLGLMTRLGSFMLRQACKDLRKMRDEGMSINWISVNLSAEQLYHPSLASEIKSLLEEFELDSSSIELEIVEELISHDSEVVQAQLNAIAELGIKLSIDDFGTGYSSLSRLKDLPVTKLKIDKAFVDGLPDLDSDRCISRSIIGLAKGMQFDLVAEGVETHAQQIWLKKHGCDFFQGYFFAKPMNLEHLLEFASQRHCVKPSQSGDYHIKKHQRVIEITPTGQWDQGISDQFFKELNRLVDKLHGQDWATIVDARSWHIATLEVQKKIASETKKITQRALRREAFVIRNTDLANYQSELMSPQVKNYIRKAFTNIEDAKQWLVEEGFE